MEEKKEILEQVREPLLSWYRENGRELLFRIGRNPYRIWISEIMLQQTRIEAVKPYFERFMTELPDVAALAEVSEERLMKLWEGLGYYSRARNLKKAAVLIMEEHGGQIPADPEALKKLPGIGPYTAGAIASIAFSVPEPAVDGNVLRVVARLLRDDRDIMKMSTRRSVEALLRDAMSKEYPGEYNEAVMEIGETVCLPLGAPLCGKCPLAEFCLAHRAGDEEHFPVRPEKKKRRREERTIFLLTYRDKLVLNKRKEEGLLAGLYELPGTEGHLSEAESRAYLRERFGIPHEEEFELIPLKEAKHIFSHVEWHMIGYSGVLPEAAREPQILAGKAELKEAFPLPNAFRAYMKEWNEGN